MLITLFIILPLISAIVALLLKKRLGVIEYITIVSSILQVILSLYIISVVLQIGSYSFEPFFRIDSLAAVLLLITPIVGLASVLYNKTYVREEIKKEIIGLRRARQSYVLINLFLLAMYGAIASTNPILTWISIEATTLSTVFLISFYNKPSTIEAAWKYLVINSIGLLLAFLGTIIYLGVGAPLIGKELVTWQDLAIVSTRLNPDVVKIAFIFIFIGYGTKLGIAPMHTWRPDAYSKAPIPVVALLSGALLNIAFFVILRFATITNNVVGVHFSQSIFIFFGVLSLFIAAFSIFKQENYKRLLAYSSIEHAGIMLLGFGFGGLGIYAGLLHMMYHSLAKSAMFLLSGNIFLKYSTTKIKQVAGVVHVLPQTGILFVFGFLSLTGVPPFGTFLTKFYILSVGMQTHPYVTIVIIFLLAMIFFGFFKSVSSMLFAEPSEGVRVKEYGLLTILPSAVLLCLMLYLSIILPGWIEDLLQGSVRMFTK